MLTFSHARARGIQQIDTMNIGQIKEKYTCLDYLGEPVKKVSYGYLYRTPWREDKHPSLSVTPNGKGWKDYATGEHGNLIDLVMKCLGTSDLGRVCAEFEHVTPCSFFSRQPNILDEREEKKSGFAWLEVGELRSKALYAYLNSRKINTDIAKQFLKEAHYSFMESRDSYLYALAYGNDKGGWELRSSRFKGCTAPKGITVHLGNDNAPMVVFEGFFDMLSFATLCGVVRHNYICLNSIVNAPAAITTLQGWGTKIYLCLDNDEGGKAATQQFLDALPGATDISHRFAPHKDVNEFLVAMQMQR